MSSEATATSTASHQEEDDVVLNDMWGDCFIGNMVSTDIYVTINESNGRNRCKTKVVTDKVTIIPRDFIPQKKTLTEEEVMTRFSVMGMSILDKRQAGSSEPMPPTPEGTQAAFLKKLLTLRECIAKLAKPRILLFFKKRFQATYPDFTFDGGRKVETPKDMADAYRMGPNNPSMRRMVYDCLIGIWGQDNGWAFPVEKVIMTKLGLEYSELNCDGQQPGKLHFGGSVKHNLVAAKQVILTPIRRVSSGVYKEMIYKKKRSLPKGMVRVVKATREEHGFDGKLGLYPGNPLLNQEAQAEDQLMDWFRKLRENGVHTKEALRAAMIEEDQREDNHGFETPTRGKKVLASDDASDTSSITSSGLNQPNGTDKERSSNGVVTPVPRTQGGNEVHPVPETVTTPPARRNMEETPPQRPVKSIATNEKEYGALSEDDEDEEEEARKKALAACKPCRHDGDGILSFIEYESKYYKPNWVAKKKNFPTNCGLCARKIVSGSKKELEQQGLLDVDPEQFYHVKGSFSIFLCCNATKEVHECKYALCKPCRQEACKKRKPIDNLCEKPIRRGRRSRKEVSLCMPGESIDPRTGYMVASV